MACSLAVALPGLAAGTAAPAGIDFNRDIRPILSEKCYSCHGPDAGQRQASLRLDTADGIVAERNGKGPAVVPGSARQSPLFERISTPDPASRMPPGYLGHEPLSDLQIRQLESWIDQGAQWQPHWAFLPVRRPEPPPVRDRGWIRNALDAFVLHRLEENGLAPSPEAAQETLIRRVTLDLTGLPPSPRDLDRVLRDPSPDAYERHVDRLLGSTRYGEHMAARWLEAARYADTNGYQSDGIRQMWRWRDWVIDAFNRNLGFHRFTIEQLAGDLLEGATLDQIVATGFNRNHRTSAEGGSIDEELRVEYVADRVETTSTVWMGLTVGCARCHDHKYDPISQQEYYRFFAFFNNVPERGFVYNYGNEDPVIAAPTPPQEARLEELDAQVRTARLRLQELESERKKAQRAWERKVREQSLVEDWSLDRGLLVHFPLDGDWSETTGNLKRVWREEAEKKEKEKEEAQEEPAEVEDPSPEPPFVDGGPEPGLEFVPGRKGQAGRFDGRFINGGPVASFDYMEPFTLSAWFYPRSGEGAIFSSVVDRFRGRGYGLYLREGKLRFNFTYRWSDLGLRLETEQVLEQNRWHHVVLSYDGKRNASHFRLHVNGVLQEPVVLFDYLLNPMGPKRDFRIGAGEGPDDLFDGFIDEIRVYDRALSDREARVIALLDPVSEIAALDRSKRSVTQQDKLDLCFLEDGHAPETVRQAVQELRKARRQRREYYDSLPTVMVMKERSERRQTYVLDRGAYDARTEPVKPGVPAAMNSRAGSVRTGPPGTGPVARGPVQPLDGPGDGEPALADVVRCRPGADSRGLRLTGRPSHPSPVAGLAGHRVHGERLGRQVVAPDRGDQRHLPPIFPSYAGAERAGPREPAVGPRAPVSPACPSDPGPGPGGVEPSRGEAGRTLGQALPATRTVGGADVPQAGLRSRPGRGPLSPESLYVLETDHRAAGHGDVRRLHPRSLHRSRRPDEHAAASPEPDERRDLPGGVAPAGRTHAGGGRSHPAGAPRLRFPPGHRPLAPAGRADRSGSGPGTVRGGIRVPAPGGARLPLGRGVGPE